jgi:hypothetical protein
MLDEAYPTLADKLRAKGRADDRILFEYGQHEREIIGLERDSVGLALEIAFDARDDLLVDGAAGKPRSFVAMLAPRMTEDEVILFDKDRFPALSRESVTPKTTIFRHNDSVLQVTHANRTSLEHTLGVDLIYLSHHFGSFVGVQYKMMEGSSSDSQFIPNAHFMKQLDDMLEVRKRLKPIAPPTKQSDYRLHGDAFYYKFVSRLETNFGDDKLCPGMYLPLEFVFQITSAVPQERIGYRYETRHLSNSEFANLVRQGWVGTRVAHTAIINDIIERALTEKHSVVVAADERL